MGSTSDEPIADPHGDPREPTTYPLPEATIAGDPTALAAVAAAIIGVFAFWRPKKRRPSA
jgi:hypothetical protein